MLVLVAKLRIGQLSEAVRGGGSGFRIRWQMERTVRKGFGGAATAERR